jgi:hypothetical protein
VRLRLPLLLLLAALALAAAGCGGGGKKSTTSAAPATSSAGSTESESTSSEDTTATATTKAKSCAELTSLAKRVSAAFQNTNAKNIDKNAKLLKQFADQTPDAVRPDFEELAKDVQKIADVITSAKDPNHPTPAEAQKIQKVASQNATKMSRAIQHISTWSAKNC